MAEREYKVDSFLIDYICDSCGIGTMQPTGVNDYTSNPMTFEHACSNTTGCSATMVFNEKYPKHFVRRVLD